MMVVKSRGTMLDCFMNYPFVWIHDQEDMIASSWTHSASGWPWGSYRDEENLPCLKWTIKLIKKKLHELCKIHLIILDEMTSESQAYTHTQQEVDSIESHILEMELT